MGAGMTHRDPDLSHPLELTRAEVDAVGQVVDDLRGQSTPAQLAQTQRALAASQQDLTTARAAIDDVEKYRKLTAEQRDRAEAERDLALAELASARRELEQGRRRIAELVDHNKRIAAGLDAKEDEVVALGFDLADAKAATTQLRVESQVIFEQLRKQNTDLEAARTWQVAGSPAGDCSNCGKPIVRSQAVEPLPASPGYFVHSMCPDQETDHA